ncbi:MAG: nucleotide exchange factor GrpE [Clostridia bacterium]|nr:nucleotide exchange factor GrpE [Clostridia bacterium]
MEDLEKELNDSCGCCPECKCGDDCHCTPDNKCCDECTCDENCNCHDKVCDCESECDCDGKCDEQCDCDDNNENCDCGNECECGKDCDCTEDDKCCEDCNCDTDNDCDSNSADKCKCGCGEDVDEQEGTADAYFKQLLSLRAEFDNYRKRTQSDISKSYSNGFNQAITEFLPALDSFKMATEYITDQNTLIGIQYIEKGILTTLEKMGVKVIDTSGKFDPNFHQAIGSETSPEHESGDIIKECFKGFMLGDKVIRYSQVIVAK